MKISNWLIMVSLALAGSVALGQTNQVYSRNVVGFVEVDLPPTGGCVFAAVNFKAVGGSNLTVAAIFGTNQLVKDTIFARADKIYLWNAGMQDFDRYAQKPSGGFYKQDSWQAGNPTNPVVANGVGFWLQSSSVATNARTIFIMGEVATNSVISSLMYPGYQCISAPFADELVVTNNDWLADGAVGCDIKTNADQIVVWNGIGFDRYGLAANGRWYSWTNWVGQGGDPVDPVIALGAGGWYLSKTNSTWIWTQPRPYSWP
jgi:hypothetical protein